MRRCLVLLARYAGWAPGAVVAGRGARVYRRTTCTAYRIVRPRATLRGGAADSGAAAERAAEHSRSASHEEQD
jgi:hypothetical protein